MTQLSNMVAAVLVQFALVAWRTKNNYRQESNYGDMNEIKNSLAQYQWVPDNPVPVCEITEAEKVAELSERQKRYDAIKGQVNPTPDQTLERKVFEQLYLNPDGTFIEPKYSGNAGFRRSTAFFPAMVEREKSRAKPENADKTISGLVPVRVTSYATDADRIIDQQLENEMQGRGTVKMQDLDKLRVTKALFDAGCLESRVRTLYSSSTGQKTFGICQANVNWPRLDIYDRFLRTSDSFGYIPWGPVRGAELVKINNRFEAERKRQEGLPLKNDERGLEPITEAQAEEWFADKAKLSDGGNATKSMAKKDMESGAKNHKLLLVRKTFDSVVNNTQGNLAKFMENADALNGVTTLIEIGKGEETTRVVKGVTEHLDLYTLFTRVVETGKLAEVKSALEMILGVAPAPAPAPAPATEVKVEPAPATEVKVESAPAKREVARSGKKGS